MKSVVKRLHELGDDLVLAPERHLAVSAQGSGATLGELVVERVERAAGDDLRVVLDTTHARDGIIDVPAALRASAAPAKSHKKVAREGDLLVSRLRPYLRQIALVHPAALKAARVSAFAVSTEFYVLRSPTETSLAWLLPWLLSDDVQSALAEAQEGGHHPRVPRETLLTLRVDGSADRAVSRRVHAALAGHYAAAAQLARALAG